MAKNSLPPVNIPPPAEPEILAEKAHLDELRRLKPARHPHKDIRTTGARVADWVADTVGSWRFIIIQSIILAFWIAANITAYLQHWDPYPFILLNLVLSFQAAYAAPIIMMSQNRQAQVDRQNAENDYKINVKAELEIEMLHAKIDALREQEILHLIRTVEQLSVLLAQKGGSPAPEIPRA